MARPPTALLDRERIATAAMELLDQTGGFTIPILAAKLGVAQSSLYHHVQGRAGIIAAIRDQLNRSINATVFAELDWRQAFQLWAADYRNSFAEHPGCIQFLAAEPISDPQLHAMYDRAAAALIDAGFPREQVLAIITAIESFVLGSALDLVAPSLMFQATDPDRTPHLADVLDTRLTGRARADQAFQIGLNALLNGLAPLATTTY